MWHPSQPTVRLRDAGLGCSAESGSIAHPHLQSIVASGMWRCKRGSTHECAQDKRPHRWQSGGDVIWRGHVPGAESRKIERDPGRIAVFRLLMGTGGKARCRPCAPRYSKPRPWCAVLVCCVCTCYQGQHNPRGVQEAADQVRQPRRGQDGLAAKKGCQLSQPATLVGRRSVVWPCCSV